MAIKQSIYSSLFFALCMSLAACNSSESDPNIVLSKDQQDPMEALETEEIIGKDMPYKQTFYVPVYSNIYVEEDNRKVMLSATLSIRNTSLTDSFYVTKIDYYDTKGDFVRSYLNKTLELPSMGTLNYIVEKLDDTGGGGANFVLEIESKNADTRPLIETIMIGTFNNKAFAFRSDSLPIEGKD